MHEIAENDWLQMLGYFAFFVFKHGNLLRCNQKQIIETLIIDEMIELNLFHYDEKSIYFKIVKYTFSRVHKCFILVITSK